MVLIVSVVVGLGTSQKAIERWDIADSEVVYHAEEDRPTDDRFHDHRSEVSHAIRVTFGASMMLIFALMVLVASGPISPEIRLSSFCRACSW